VQVFGAKILRLFLHILDELRPVNPIGKPGEVLDEGGQGELSAGFMPADHKRA